MLLIEEIPARPKEEKVIRVAAYARVSSDKDAAFHSLEAQTEYYEEYISNRPGWELVGCSFRYSLIAASPGRTPRTGMSSTK